jgi:small GTP-binding protein
MSSFKLHLLLVGAVGVGKTDFVENIIRNRFAPDYKLTVGVDILTKDVEFRLGEVATLSISDIGMQQRFEPIRDTFYKGKVGIIMIFDIMREETYAETREWLAEIRQIAGAHVPFLLIGNTAKMSKTNKLAIDRNNVREFVNNEGGIYIEASPNMTQCIEKALIELTRKILESRG